MGDFLSFIVVKHIRFFHGALQFYFTRFFIVTLLGTLVVLLHLRRRNLDFLDGSMDGLMDGSIDR